jgi:uncharacterized protein (DUF1778 family)
MGGGQRRDAALCDGMVDGAYTIEGMVDGVVHNHRYARELYVRLTYTQAMETRSNRWTVRVTPAQDAVVRRVLELSGESLSEYVVRHAVEAATEDLADRRIFALDDDAWDELEALLDRPPVRNTRLDALLSEPSVLERPDSL